MKRTELRVPHPSAFIWPRLGIATLILAIVVAAPIFAVAQQSAPAEHKAEPAAQQQPEGQKSEPQKHEEGKPAQAGQHKETMGEELAETSREAAGEEGDKFKHSPTVRLLASKTGMSPKTAYWVFLGVNFVGISLVVRWIWRNGIPGIFGPIGPSFPIMRGEIRKQLEEARAASAEARTRLSGIEERLSKIDAEISSMRAGTEAEAKKQEEQIIAAAEEDKKRIVAAAQQEIAGATRAARQDLKSYAAELAVDLAARSINVDAPTDRALVHNFAEQFGKDGQ
jgi:F-type H+-transporting ATPase subunit b